MSITLTTSFVTQTNLVMPLAQNASGLSVRVASQGSGTLGTLTASGFIATPTWTVSGSAPSWVASSVNPAGNVCTLTFSTAQYQQTPYEFFVSCTDGTTTAYFAIYLEVKAPFTLAANTSNPVVVSGSSLNIPSFDASIADVVIQGLGLYNSVQANCNFILPSDLPPGLNFVTSNEGQLILRVAEPHFGVAPFFETDLVGGLQLYTTSPEAIPLIIQAYQPGSFYDEPDRPYTLSLSVASQSQSVGTLDFGIGAHYNTISNLLELDAEIDTLLGTLQSQGVEVPQPLQYYWSNTMPTPNSGGGITDASVTYSITSTAPASVTLQITDAHALPILNGTKTINFSEVSNSNTSWLSTAAIKVGVAATAPFTGTDVIFGDTSQTVNVTLSSPDGFNALENIILTLDVEQESTIEESQPTRFLPIPVLLH